MTRKTPSLKRSTLLLIISITLVMISGCSRQSPSSKDEVLEDTPVPNNTLEGSITLTPAITSSASSNTPTWTPPATNLVSATSTLTFEASFEFERLLPPSYTEDCTLPCWYNLEINKSNRQDVQNILSNLFDFQSDIDFFQAIDPQARADLTNGLPNLEVAGYLWHDNPNDGYDNGSIELVVWVDQHTELLQGILVLVTTGYVNRSFTPVILLQELGEPDHIALYVVDESRFLAVVSTYIYLAQGITVRFWQMIPQERREDRVYCLDDPNANVTTYIVAPTISLDPLDLTPMQRKAFLENVPVGAIPIIERIDLTLNEFAENAISQENYCLTLE